MGRRGGREGCSNDNFRRKTDAQVQASRLNKPEHRARTRSIVPATRSHREGLTLRKHSRSTSPATSRNAGLRLTLLRQAALSPLSHTPAPVLQIGKLRLERDT